MRGVARTRWTQERVDSVKKSLSGDKTHKLIKKYGDHFSVMKGKLMYQNREIVFTDERRREIMKQFYYDISQASGITKTEFAISQLYLGLTSAYIREFIKS